MKRKLILAAAVVTLGATLAVAAPNEGQRREHRREAAQKFAQTLNLSDGQREQIRPRVARNAAKGGRHRRRFNVSRPETYIAANENRRRLAPPSHPADLRFVPVVRL